MDNKEYYTAPTEKQRRILKSLWKRNKAEALQYFKEVYNLTALNKKPYKHAQR